MENNVTDANANEPELFSNDTIEGISLADRLAQGVLPPQEALRYATEIGSALNRAHRRGVIHGKLSAHSILLTPSGARILPPAEGTDLDALPYRAPEVVSGGAPDWRSDIFSYGALLYEMVSGRRAFSGEGAALDRAIQENAPASLMSKSPVHAAMEGVIAGCLEKDPAARRQRAQNAVIELKLAARLSTRLSEIMLRPAANPVGQPATDRVAPSVPDQLLGDEADIRPKRPRIFVPVRFPDEILAVPFNPRRQRLMLWWLLAVSVLFIAAGVWIAWQLFHPAPVPVYKLTVAPPNNTTYRMPAISPDGKYVVVLSAGPEGKPMLWKRALDVMKPDVIPGTEGAFAPFWSPDSQFIAFFADKALKKVRVDGGPAEKICDAEPLAGGGTWNTAGTILFAPGQGTTLYQVPANGGKPQPLFKLNAGQYEHAHLWPQFLPDGKHFVFFVLSDSPAATGVYTGSLDSAAYTMLFQSGTNAVYSDVAGGSGNHGYLLYIRERSLMGVGFHAGRLQLVGEPIRLAEDVGAIQSLSLAPISISANDILVFQSVAPASRQLSWMDRGGKTLVTVAEGGSWGPPRISPDGSRAIVAKLGNDRQKADLWIVDQAGNATQFTFGPADKGSPVWSPDGSRTSYFSETDGSFEIVVSPANSGTKVESLFKSPQAVYPTDWSHDGKYLLFWMRTASAQDDVWALSLPDRRAGPLLDTVYSENFAALSPDGKWLAFQSNETGRNEVYVQPFEGISGGTKRRYNISTEAGGGLPRWRADGQELFYMTNSGRMMSVNVHAADNEFQNDPPQPLFQTRPIPHSWNLYDVAPDGQRFLMNLPLEWPNSSPITVMTNWTEKLRKLKE